MASIHWPLVHNKFLVVQKKIHFNILKMFNPSDPRKNIQTTIHMSYSVEGILQSAPHNQRYPVRQ